MSYLQLSFAGIPTYVERGNSLSQEHFEGAWTPSAYVFRAHHGHLFPEQADESPTQFYSEPIPTAQPKTKQLSLFDFKFPD